VLMPFPQPPLFEIWEESNPAPHTYPWRAQLAGYVGQFLTREAAEKYVNHVKNYREKFGGKK
jgi:hypothetical protein